MLTSYHYVPHVQGVLQLGGALAKSPKDCTHLVTNKIQRTVKLLSAFGSAKFVVTPRWIQDSIANNAFVGKGATGVSALCRGAGWT